ncbi:MAG: NapC/NirT family cytochrome c, partial [Coriobacteriia bacterium]|nr:NapC/NirT family cytochrome c [Coriobacteriia bacterium]
MARKVRSWMLVHPALASLSFLGMLVVVVLGFLGAAQATDQAVFCNSCHEMSPYYSAWREGPHADVPCVDCHVDSNKVKQLTHKFVALEEVWVHIAGEPTFPMTENAPIPDKRCLSCHEDITEPGYAGFSHKDHAAKGPCTDCHDNAGHTVTAADLEAAGILNVDGLKANTERRIAAVGQGTANLEGHVKTACASCHDMKATGCASCHTPKHEKRPQSCTTCHTTDAKWAFAHPESDTCVDCHALPKDHVKTAASVRCAVCHSERGVKWTFSHPARTDCETCHVQPAGHKAGTCASCHTQTGVSWAATHPAAGSSCATCHNAPAKHRSGACQTCHKKTGTSWAFTHPAGASCTTCHKAPAKHRSGACQTCHKKTGVNWAFSHPAASANCAT